MIRNNTRIHSTNDAALAAVAENCARTQVAAGGRVAVNPVETTCYLPSVG